jgi:UDP-N-acetylmuramoyl-L-alanyl-D-glutamate--2,6-diaminopimelate ligase
MQLSELVADLPSQKYNMKDIEINSIEFDSRKVKAGSMYIAVKGDRYDGHDFVEDAVRAGAVAVATEHKVETDIPQVVVDSTRDILSKVALNFYGSFAHMEKVGVTGTNGKTTTTFLIRSILMRAGKKPGLIGTVYYQGATKSKATRTTPEILDTLKLLKEFQEQGMDSVVMEVSSHALKLGRVEGIEFDAAVFTNLSQDHLDFHVTMDDYMRSKLRIFSLLKQNGFAIYNNDEDMRDAVKSMALPRALSFGQTEGSDIRGRLVEQSIDGLKIEVSCMGKAYEVNSSLIGRFNFHNILGSFAAGVALDVEADHIIEGIERLRSVPGRMERIVDNIFVDYAHTPAAIENILRSAGEYTRGRLVVVFGCGGDRDRDKRAKMGAIATRLADFAVITTDNPRHEAPTAIISDILKGVAGENYTVIEDRTAAIEYAISTKQEDDMVIVAGKGHEDYQIFDDETIDFSDAEVIKRCFENSC